MSEFSEKIKEVIKKSNLTMPYLSEMCGLSVPNLYKICQGKRLPKEKDKIIALIEALQCPKSEEISLIKKYQIELLGKNEYCCLETVRELLSKVGRKEHVGMYYYGKAMDPDINVLLGKTECIRYVQQMLMQETEENPGGIVKIIGGENNDYLLESIRFVFMNSETVCRHIVRLDSKSVPESDLRNIRLVASILPSALCGSSYCPFYFYEYGKVKNNKIQLFHSTVILRNKVILLLDDYDKAVILKSSEQIELMNQVFDSYLEDSIPMVRHVDDLYHWQKLIGKMETENRKRVPYVLESMACTMSVMDESFIQNHVAEHTPEAEQALKKYMDEITAIRKDREVCYSTKSGLFDFAATGRIEYIPEKLYTPLTVGERIEILEKMKESWQENNKYYILNDSRFSVSDHLFVAAISESENIIGYYTGQERFSACLLDEKGIASWIYQFLRYLEDSDLVLSHEETIQLVDQVIYDLEQGRFQ